MRRASLGLVTLVFTLAAGVSSTAYAKTLISELASYAKDPAKGVIDGFQKAGVDLIAQGQAAGNGMISHAGMEIDAASRSAINGLGADLNKNVEDLTEGEQTAILALLQLEQTGQKTHGYGIQPKRHDDRGSRILGAWLALPTLPPIFCAVNTRYGSAATAG
jgi:hypothetical protein